MSGSLTYFSAIETLFIELRGSPLLLSPADWKVAEEWRDEGIPLTIVEAALRELFAERAVRGAKKVPGLRYCSRAVRRKFEQQRALTAGSGRSLPLEIDLCGRLAELVRLLPEGLVDRSRLADALGRLADLDDPAQVEDRLAALDCELLEALESALGPPELAELDAAVETILRPLAAKLSEPEHSRLRAARRLQLLRQRSGAPVLSLFNG